MELFFDAYQYYLENQGLFWQAMGRHLTLSLTALAISVLIGVPLGIWISRRARAAELAINGFGALRLVPSLAILFLALPYLGTGFRPALFALTVLAVPPVLINTYAGIRNVDRAVVEAASGMGMEPGPGAAADRAADRAAGDHRRYPHDRSRGDSQRDVGGLYRRRRPGRFYHAWLRALRSTDPAGGRRAGRSACAAFRGGAGRPATAV